MTAQSEQGLAGKLQNCLADSLHDHWRPSNNGSSANAVEGEAWFAGGGVGTENVSDLHLELLLMWKTIMYRHCTLQKEDMIKKGSRF